MKKIVPFWLVALLLCGCSQSNRELERGLSLRSRLLASDACTFCADITADYGDQIHTFSMDCQADRDGNLSFRVTQPESISGITGTITAEGGKLTFGETALSFPLMADDQLSPVSAPWIFLKTLRSGCLTSTCMEEGLLRMSLDDSYDDDALHLDIWLEEEDKPVRAEILYDSRRILMVSVRDFQIQ